jgi:lysophospholipase L1-like esterase
LTDGFVYASSTSPNISMRTGANVGPTVAPLINAWTAVTYTWNSSSSIGQIKSQLQQGGNPGTISFGGMALGATPTPGSFGAVSFGEMVVRNVVDTMLTKHRHTNWLMRRAAISYHNLVCEGDSLTAGAGLGESSLFPYKFLQLKGLTTTPWGYRIQATGGEDVADLVARAGTTDMFLDETPQNILTVWVGTNNLVAGSTPQQTLTALAAYCRARRAMGWKVAVFTTLPRNVGDNFENKRLEYNQLIRDYRRDWSDYFVDIGADATIGQYGQQDNLTYYVVGGTHLTAAGQQIVADLLNTVLV